MTCSNCRREIANESNFCYLCGARQQPANYAYSSGPVRRLHRSVRDCKIGGVCGGLAEYWDMDPTVIRVIAAVLIFLPTPVILGYFIAWIVIPKEDVFVYAPAPGQSQPSQTQTS
ncbi:MAG: PspC domain-containing protein [Candidatus Acidiferrales bacterium]